LTQLLFATKIVRPAFRVCIRERKALFGGGGYSLGVKLVVSEGSSTRE